ncbi:MAG: hypothetical protein COA79_19590 [Planctomycetota bacterium]|nr:MAG: hypothetical protein COA79_19590 [Planctomycetota bacterium]
MTEEHIGIINTIHSASSSEELFETIQQVCHNCISSDSFKIYFIDEETEDLDLYYGNADETNEECQQALVSLLQEKLIQNDTAECFIMDQPDSKVSNLVAAYQLQFQDTIYGCFTIHKDNIPTENNWINDFKSIAQAVSPEIIKIQLLEAANSEALLAQSKLHGMYNSLELIKNSELDTILIKLMNLALQTIKGQVGSILIIEDEKLVTKTDMGFSDEIAQSIKNYQDELFIQYAYSQVEPTHITDTIESDLIDVSNLPVNVTSIISIPLRTQSHNLGLLNIINNEENFDEINFEVLLSLCNLSSYALENALLFKKNLANAKLKESMDIAQSIQSSLLPKPELTIKNIEVFGWSQACDETGGDYYDLIPFEDKRLDVIVGDATGHGIGAALTMLITRSSLRTLYQQKLPLDHMYELLNNRLSDDTNDEKFMTLFTGCFDIENNTLTYCSAGHDGPLFIRGDEEVQELEATGIPLGMMEDMEYEVVENIPLKPGDLILTGSDGTWEAMNNDKEEYGKQRMIDIAKECRNESAQKINLKIQASIKEFISDYKIRDDMTLIVIKVN